MMRALVVRDLRVAARRAAAPLTVWAVGLSMTGFVVIWSPGVSVLAPINLYDQTRLLQWILLAAMLPWVAVRSMPEERANQFVLTSALTGLSPETLVTGRAIAACGLLLLVVVSGLPSLVLAQQAAAVPFLPVLGHLLSLVGLAMLTAVTATACRLVMPSSLGAWAVCAVIISMVLIALVRWSDGAPLVGAACALIALVGTGWLRHWSTRALCYLRSDDER